jgi:hypothetical protein
VILRINNKGGEIRGIEKQEAELVTDSVQIDRARRKLAAMKDRILLQDQIYNHYDTLQKKVPQFP